MSQERRRHPRIRANHLTTVFLPAPEGAGREEVVGRTIDLSHGGILLETAGGIEEGMAVTVSIAVGDALIELGGDVLRVQPVGEGFFEVAIVFGAKALEMPQLIDIVRARLLGGAQ
jgi:hypothetical protein